MSSPELRPRRPVDGVEIRRADPGEIGAIVELARTALGWAPDDPNEAFFRWKHLDNPAGPSPMWVAVDHGRLVGVRVFLRWRFVGPDGRVLRAVRAVDTATHPDAQGRGIFSALTLAALDELAEEGVDLVFNTPNDQSRPGYLKMGWQVVGRVPIAVRPHGPRSLAAMARSREPATKWSSPTPAGRPAAAVLADTSGVTALLDRLADPTAATLHTDRTPEHLRWRYRFEPLRYRAVVAPGGASDGLAVFRLRARGRAREAAVCELLAPDVATARLLLHEVAAATGADYLIAVASTGSARRWRMAPLPNQGPVLTWRAVTTPGPAPTLDRWGLSLGDVELF